MDEPQKCDICRKAAATPHIVCRGCLQELMRVQQENRYLKSAIEVLRTRIRKLETLQHVSEGDRKRVD